MRFHKRPINSQLAVDILRHETLQNIANKKGMKERKFWQGFDGDFLGSDVETIWKSSDNQYNTWLHPDLLSRMLELCANKNEAVKQASNINSGYGLPGIGCPDPGGISDCEFDEVASNALVDFEKWVEHNSTFQDQINRLGNLISKMNKNHTTTAHAALALEDAGAQCKLSTVDTYSFAANWMFDINSHWYGAHVSSSTSMILTCAALLDPDCTVEFDADTLRMSAMQVHKHIQDERSGERRAVESRTIEPLVNKLRSTNFADITGIIRSVEVPDPWDYSVFEIDGVLQGEHITVHARIHALQKIIGRTILHVVAPDEESIDAIIDRVNLTLTKHGIALAVSRNACLMSYRHSMNSIFVNRAQTR